jgi:hypothetical protein
MPIPLSDIKEAFFNPATGRTQDAVHPITGRGLWSGLSHAELNSREGVELERLSMDEAAERQAQADRQRYCTGPQRVTDERAEEMLNVLPPYRWANHGSFEVFAMGEPLCGDLVTWFVRVGRQWFELNESSTIPADRLMSLCQAA